MMQEVVQQVKATIQEFIDGVHTAIPGVIAAFDPAKCEASVNLTGQYNKPDGTKLPYPAAAHVPVVFPQVSNQEITIAFPIKPGDGCLVIIAEQALEAWRAGGESNLDLKHDLTNAIVIPGLFRTPNAVMQEAVSEDAIMLVNQGTKVKIKGQEIHIETPKIEIQTEKIHITGEVEIDKELTVKGIKFTPHVHKEVAKGGDKSGPPEGGE
ncbi:MAG: hypothetical protein HFG18_10520 [Oscillospiraceae bacterium]|nr:hypothetical protein [Oscillospiraceae bacterium]